ncbi:MAG TPA: cytochrome c biogenesis protein ResB [Chthoniobacter sp.]|jgi:hypothetical protein
MSRSIWKFLTSLRVTVVLLACAIILVFVGTVAQADEGLFQVQERYFRHWYIIGTTLWGHHLPWFVWPGGYTLGFGLLINLIAAHIKRFQWKMSKFGIHLTHLGIIILLVGQLATDMLQVESHMTFMEGDTGNFIESPRHHELVFVADAGKGNDEVVSVPEAMLVKGKEISHPKLPFKIEVKDYSPNGDVYSKAKVEQAVTQIKTALTALNGEFSTPEALAPLAQRDQENPGRVQFWRDALAAVGEKNNDDIVAAAKKVAAEPDRAAKLLTELKTRFGSQMRRAIGSQGAAEQLAANIVESGQTVTPEMLPPASTSGAGASVTVKSQPEAKDMDTQNIPYAVLDFIVDGKSAGTWLVSPALREQDLALGGKKLQVALRDERTYLPFSLKLLQATHKDYAGSDTPKDFRSRMLIDNPGTKENREVEISMNDPLRYGGLAFYQYQMTKDEMDQAPGRSVLQVVHNPSWLAPYIGCIVVALGMIWQFLHHLVGFITKRRAV